MVLTCRHRQLQAVMDLQDSREEMKK